LLVFIDSDCRPDPAFIRRLVGPLHNPRIGATTGYRWYHPPAPNLGSLLRSAWNAGALPFLIDPKRVFAWGGAMAIRRGTFARAGIAEAWDKAVSDDMTLTVAVRHLGLEVRFVPQCIAVSYETSTVAETLEFTNRQSIISRIYFPPLWWSTALGHALANVLMLYGLISLGVWAHGGEESFLLGAMCLMLLPLQLANAAWLFGSARELLPTQVRKEIDRLRWHYIFTAPLASIMTLINTIHAATTRRITWRGITYELVSPTETVVVKQ
jgi:cellulose synthase/poly-beta-1,6-N-acetylglucosamine synthase-like glycosyltransferase